MSVLKRLDRHFNALLFTSVVLGTVFLSWWHFVPIGLTEESALMFTRYTARFSFVFFLPIFVVGAWHQLYPSPVSRLLMRHRRQMGLAFALAHMVHMGAILALFEATGEWFTVNDIAALVIYLFIGLMAATSNGFSMRRLRGAWPVLHKVGLYGIFIGFFTTYLGRVQNYHAATLDESLKDPIAIYVLLAAIITAAWVLRIVAFWQKRHPKAA